MTTHDEVDVLIVGAGVVGLACAAACARIGRSVVIVERNDRIAEETSTRNSGVIHAGIYYPHGSLKARLCVEGRDRVYARCERLSLPYRRCGKLIVATDEDERRALEALCKQGLANHAGALRMLDQAELHALEPNVHAIAALFSPATGIVDPFALADSYRREAVALGAALVLRTEIIGLAPNGDALLVQCASRGGERFAVRAQRVINAAGLAASSILELAGLSARALDRETLFCKGDYFELAPSLRGLVRHLVYPMPSRGGLGIHVTLDLEGNLRAGPDAEYVDGIQYRVEPSKASVFAEALRRYLPSIREEHLSPGYAGIRPKLQRPGEPARDFVIESASAHGIPALINLVGIESPGMTASEAIADRVVACLA